jgi:hypothetical protein
VTCDRLVVFSGSSGSSTNKTDHHDITEILLNVAPNTIKQTNKINITLNAKLLYLKNDTAPGYEMIIGIWYFKIIIDIWYIKIGIPTSLPRLNFF